MRAAALIEGTLRPPFRSPPMYAGVPGMFRRRARIEVLRWGEQAASAARTKWRAEVTAMFSLRLFTGGIALAAGVTLFERRPSAAGLGRSAVYRDDRRHHAKVDGEESPQGDDRTGAFERKQRLHGRLRGSMTGVPATADMHFRNGALAFTYMATCCSSSSTRTRRRSKRNCRRTSPNFRTRTRSRCAASPR